MTLGDSRPPQKVRRAYGKPFDVRGHPSFGGFAVRQWRLEAERINVSR
jgi:hypothetical protein